MSERDEPLRAWLQAFAEEGCDGDYDSESCQYWAEIDKWCPNCLAEGAARQIDGIRESLAACQRELAITDELLAARQKVLDAIPACPAHGACIPAALDWIDSAKAAMLRAEAAEAERDRLRAALQQIVADVERAYEPPTFTRFLGDRAKAALLHAKTQ